MPWARSKKTAPRRRCRPLLESDGEARREAGTASGIYNQDKGDEKPWEKEKERDRNYDITITVTLQGTVGFIGTLAINSERTNR